MEFLLEIIEISPSISQLKTNNNVIYILFFDNKGLENIFNLEEIFIKNSPISLKLNNIKQKIKICLQINDKIFGECDFIPFNNDTKVINIINSGLKNYNFNGNKINTIKLKIKCFFNEVFNIKKKSSKNINIVKKPSNNIKMKYLTSSPVNVCKQKTSKNIINKNIFEKKKNSSNNSIYNLKYNNSCEEILNTSKNINKKSYREIIDKNRKKMFFDEISSFSNNNNNLSINQNLYNSMIFKNVPNNKRNSSIKLKCKMRSTGNSESKKSNKKNYKLSNSMINNQNNKLKFHNKNESFSLRAFIKNSIFTENNINNNNNNNNLEEKYKSIEETLIDKNLENDLLNDENLISNKKILTLSNNNNNLLNNNINNFNLNISNSRSNLIVTREETNQNSSFSEEIENKKKKNKNNFYDLKNDFEIFYTDDYIKNVKDDILKLEINLIFEKIFEIQKSFHKELKNYQMNFKLNNKNFNNILEKFLILQKQNQKLKNEIEKSFYNQNNLSEKNQKNFDIIKINKNEINFWKNFNFFMKDKLKDLFKKIVFDKFDIYKYKLDNVENIIIEKLMIKYKYKKINNNNNKNSQRNNSRTNSLIKNNYFSINQNKINNNNNNKILFTTTSKNHNKKLPNFKKN